MNKKYTLEENSSRDMALRNFEVTVQDDDVSLTWDWPIDRHVRLILVFKYLDDNPDIKTLVNSSHEVVVRDLASHFTNKITEERCKYLLAPAYFDENRNIIVCDNTVTTNWIYKKQGIFPKVVYTSIPLGSYKKVVLSGDYTQVPEDAIFYTIVSKDTNQRSYPYPLDHHLMQTGGHVYLQKNQYIEFHVDEHYMDTIEIFSQEEEMR